MPSAKKEAKKKMETQMLQKAQKGGEVSGKSKGGKGQKQEKQRNDIVPWGWEQQAKDERKKKVAERQVAEQAARAVKEARDNPDATAKPVKKQPATKDGEGKSATGGVEGKAKA